MSNVMRRTLETIKYELVEKIKKELKIAFSKIVKEEVVRLQKLEGLNELLNKKGKLEKTSEKIEKEIEEIDNQIGKVDGRLTRSEENEASDSLQKHLNWADLRSAYGFTRLQLKAMQNLLNTQEAKNLEGFDKLVENLDHMFDLAVTQKEKRAMLVTFINKDWNSLGVELPQIPYLEQTKIKDGKIVVPTNLLSAPLTK